MICFCSLLGLSISHLAPRVTRLSVAMHTRGEEECGTNVASQNGLRLDVVWFVHFPPNPHHVYRKGDGGQSCLPLTTKCFLSRRPGGGGTLVWLRLASPSHLTHPICFMPGLLMSLNHEASVASREPTDRLTELNSFLQTQYTYKRKVTGLQM